MCCLVISPYLYNRIPNKYSSSGFSLPKLFYIPEKNAHIQSWKDLTYNFQRFLDGLKMDSVDSRSRILIEGTILAQQKQC